jgi:hypothetical protein
MFMEHFGIRQFLEGKEVEATKQKEENMKKPLPEEK